MDITLTATDEQIAYVRARLKLRGMSSEDADVTQHLGDEFTRVLDNIRSEVNQRADELRDTTPKAAEQHRLAVLAVVDEHVEIVEAAAMQAQIVSVHAIEGER